MQLSQKLSQETIKILRRVYRQSKNHQVRQRAHFILLIDSEYEISELIKIFGVSRKTIYNWKNNWAEKKLVGLYNRAGRGRKETFNQEQKELIKKWTKQNSKNLKKVLALIQQEWGIKTSKHTIKRVLKSLGMKWKRLRRVVGVKPDSEIYQRRKKILKALQKLSDLGSLDLRYKG